MTPAQSSFLSPCLTMRRCVECGRRLSLSKFSSGRRVCKRCRADAERERVRAERAEALARGELDDEDRARRAEWVKRVRAREAERNAERRRLGLPERPPLDLEPGWLQRMQARVAKGIR